MMEWQPIETAPKDGRTVLGWFDHPKQIADPYAETVYWNGVEWCWLCDHDSPAYGPRMWTPFNAPPPVQP